MRIAILGRTKALLDTAKLLVSQGHEIPVIWTCEAAGSYQVTELDFKEYASQIGADFFDDVRINVDKNRAILKSYSCDVGVSMNWLTILRQPLLEMFPHGVLNAHAGDLPRYRGNAAPNWAILNNEGKIGLSIHKMMPELDAGPIYSKSFYSLLPETYVEELYEWVYSEVPKLFCQTVNGLQSGAIKGVPQSERPQDALRAFPRRPEDAQIDWNNSAPDIHRLIRASSKPFAGAFSFLEGKEKVTIFRADIFDPGYEFLAVNGQVCFAVEGDPIIACSNNSMLRLAEVFLPGLSGDESKKKILKSLRNRLGA